MHLGPTLLERVVALNRWPLALVVLLLALAAWVAERSLRARWNASRLKLMEGQLLEMRDALAIAATLWGLGQLLQRFDAPEELVIGMGIVALVAWMYATLRAARVLVFQWLFAHSLSEGVPVLLVDLFSLAASVVFLGALLHTVFLIEVTSLLATSAVLSVVLGLALQDTLGQLFAGISLQLDRPFRLGDWVEVHTDSGRLAGQVMEVSWRATLLLAVGEELITIPNKTMAQGLVLNFSGRERPFVRGHLFRLPLDVDLALAKRLLLQAAMETKGIVHAPAPVPLVMETTESWVAVKLIAFVADFGGQFTIGDAFLTRALELLGAHGIRLAAPRLQLQREIPPPG